MRISLTAQNRYILQFCESVFFYNCEINFRRNQKMPPKVRDGEDADATRVRRIVLHLAKQSRQMSLPKLFDIKKLPEEDASKLRQLKQILKLVYFACLFFHLLFLL
jgi:hypothetical protein